MLNMLQPNSLLVAASTMAQSSDLSVTLDMRVQVFQPSFVSLTVHGPPVFQIVPERDASNSQKSRMASLRPETSLITTKIEPPSDATRDSDLLEPTSFPVERTKNLSIFLNVSILMNVLIHSVISPPLNVSTPREVITASARLVCHLSLIADQIFPLV